MSSEQGHPVPPALRKLEYAPGLGPWLEALRGLRDNPVLNYLQRIEARRWQRGRTRWIGNMVLLGGILLLAASLVVINAYVDYQAYVQAPVPQPGSVAAVSLWEHLLPALGIFCAIVVAGVCALLLLSSLAGALSNCLGLLSAGNPRRLILQLDDQLMLTSLSDHEIACAALAYTLARMAPAIWGVSFGLWLLIMLQLSEFGTQISAPEVWRAALALPLTVGGLALGMFLSTLILALAAIVLGRGLRSASLRASAPVIAGLANLVWLGGALVSLMALGSSLNYSGGYDAGPLSFGVQLAYCALGLGATAILLALALQAAILSRPWRTLLLALWPLLTGALLALTAYALLGGGGYSYYDNSHQLVTLGLGHALGLVFPFNFQYLPQLACLGVPAAELLEFQGAAAFIGLPRWLLTLAAQLAAVAACAGLAVRSVARRRREGI